MKVGGLNHALLHSGQDIEVSETFETITEHGHEKRFNKQGQTSAVCRTRFSTIKVPLRISDDSILLRVGTNFVTTSRAVNFATT
jgi:hypothetical protein